MRQSHGKVHKAAVLLIDLLEPDLFHWRIEHLQKKTSISCSSRSQTPDTMSPFVDNAYFPVAIHCV